MREENNTGADICERILLWMVRRLFRQGEIFLRIQNIASDMNMTVREVREYLDILFLSGAVGCTPLSPGASSAMHTNDRSLTMVDLFCCAGATARLVSEAGSEGLSRVIASGRAVLTRVLVAGDEVPPRE